MHIASPIIALWFLRQWRRLAIILLMLDVLLCFAIVLLEYHYVMDLIGGIAVAALAILMVDSPRFGKLAGIPLSTDRVQGE
jgi:membrane-associated phospholipid phosphatase